MKTKIVKGKEAPIHLPVANAAAKKLAQACNCRPFNFLPESIGDTATTAHILGGCHMGTSAENGVIRTNRELFGYPGIYVTDGSAVSDNIGANPSLTITAMAERAMSLIPDRTLWSHMLSVIAVPPPFEARKSAQECPF